MKVGTSDAFWGHNPHEDVGQKSWQATGEQEEKEE